MLDRDATCADIVAFLEGQCGLPRSSYSPSSPLVSSGLIDSFTVFALLAYVSERFGVPTPDLTCEAHVVDTVSGLTDWIVDQRSRTDG